MKYLLPCQQCGEKLMVDVSQAGRQLTCRCGVALEVPSLRAIRELETVADPVAKPSRQSWNLSRGIVFAAGLVLTVAGFLTAGVAGFNWATATIPPPPTVEVAPMLAEVDALTPAGTWDAWVDLRTNGLGPYYPPTKVLVEASIERLFRIMVGALAVAAVGIAMAAVSMLLPLRTAT